MNIKTAVIPCAGLGTRFLPASKSIPKEMLPLVDKPIILHIVEEAVAAGIEHVILVTGRNKSSIEEFFDRNIELEENLKKTGKIELLDKIKKISQLITITSIRQKDPLGLGHAVLCAAPAIGDAPFAVLLGDEIMVGKPTVTEQLAGVFSKTGLSTIAVMDVAESEVQKYGIAETKRPLRKKEFSEIINLIEKPTKNETPSRLALPGRYIFTPTIFKILRDTKPSKNGEVQLTDAMLQLAKSEGLLAYDFEGHRYDAGDKFGYLCANIELGLVHPETGPQLKNYILNLAGKLK